MTFARRRDHDWGAAGVGAWPPLSAPRTPPQPSDANLLTESPSAGVGTIPQGNPVDPGRGPPLAAPFSCSAGSDWSEWRTDVGRIGAAARPRRRPRELPS
jgi:hypothetical protein